MPIPASEELVEPTGSNLLFLFLTDPSLGLLSLQVNFALRGG